MVKVEFEEHAVQSDRLARYAEAARKLKESKDTTNDKEEE